MATCRFSIMAGDLRIGASNLEQHDAGMNVRSGVFVPSKEYSTVRAVFQLFDPHSADNDTYFKERDRLNLRVIDSAGHAIPGTVHITDLVDDLEQLEITILPAAV